MIIKYIAVTNYGQYGFSMTCTKKKAAKMAASSICDPDRTQTCNPACRQAGF
jgi:hypothetical protein